MERIGMERGDVYFASILALYAWACVLFYIRKAGRQTELWHFCSFHRNVTKKIERSFGISMNIRTTTAESHPFFSIFISYSVSGD